MKQPAGKWSRRLWIGQGGFSVRRRCETEKSADDDIGKSSAAYAFLHAALALRNSYWCIILVAVRAIKFPCLCEWPFLSHLGRAAVEIKCFVGKTKPPHRANCERRPAIVCAHRPMIGPVGNAGSGIFKAHRTHPVAH